jgi:hypothetical protein
MNSEFENQLQRQPLREIPLHWRGKILAAAQPQPSRWREWFWPCPQAWATLAAVWIVIFGLNVSMAKDPGQVTQPTPPLSHAALLEFRQQQAMLMTLIVPAEVPEAEPPKPAVPRRSEIRKSCLIV